MLFLITSSLVLGVPNSTAGTCAPRTGQPSLGLAVGYEERGSSFQG